MDVGREGRSSISGRLEATSSFSPTSERVNLATTSAKVNGNCHGHHHHEQPRHQLQSQLMPQPQQQHHFKNRSMKVFNKVQIVYYLTRNGQLEHPHFMEVSHLATQPLRLKDVLDRLTVLRGKAMPCQYSWSCKRSYKNGYVWNDLTENDVIYAAEGSEYVLKGSEIIHDIADFSEIRLDEVQNKRRQQRKRSQLNTSGMVTNKPGGAHQGRIHEQVAIKNCEQQAANKNCDHQTKKHDDDEEEEEEEEEDEKGSCNSSTAPYPTMQIEQEESYSLHSTSSNNSDKQPPPPPTQGAKGSGDKGAVGVVKEDGDPAVCASLTRNSAALLHLIACGGGIMSPQGNDGKLAKEKANNSAGASNRSFNFSMKNSFIMPCLKQQLSTRGASADTTNGAAPLRLKGGDVAEQRHDDHHVVSKDDEDEDMMIVRCMSENPRFGNLQSEDKEYFSGTIIEAMTAHHQHTHSTGSASSQPHHPQPLTPLLTKSSSYNEQRNTSAGLQAATSNAEDEDDEKEDAKVRGIIKLCIPRKKSCSSSTKHT